jgi:AraC-like DNA-binding protein
MVFEFNARSALLLPFVVPGTVLTGFLLLRAARTGSRPDLLLALLVAWPTLAVSQWLLGYANWYDSHDAHSTLMFYVPWQVHLALGPLWFLYFRALTNQEFKLRSGAWRHLLPGLLEISLFAGAALLDLGWRWGLRGEALPDHFGTKGAAATGLDSLSNLLTYAGYVLLLGYGLYTLQAYRRYRRYLDDNFSDPERLRFAGLRQVLILLLLSLAFGLVYLALEAALGPFSYDAAWYGFVMRGCLIYALAVVGLQANYAAATSPLRFEAVGAPASPGLIVRGFISANAKADSPTLSLDSSNADSISSTSNPNSSNSNLISSIWNPNSPSVSLNSSTLDSNSTTSDSNSTTANPISPGSGATSPPASSIAPDWRPSLVTSKADLTSPNAGPPDPAALPPELQPLREKLLTLMQNEQPWLEPELTLTELAHRLHTNPAVLSKVINAGCGQNFNDFVNTYRVAEARRKLADPRFAHYSLVGVALESGFNSKSTFNRVFKKLTGQAPSELVRPKS